MAEADGFDLEKPARELTKGVLQGLWDWFRGRAPSEKKPSRGILVLGAGGTGKTTLARLLSGDLNWLDEDPGRFRASPDLERFTLSSRSGGDGIEVVVAPGEDFRRPSTWPELCAQIGAGGFRGVVLVNAYGHHTFSTRSYKDHRLYEGSKPEFWANFLADRRAEELRVLGDLVPHLAACPRKLWLFSVVAKQDLWASQQRVVEELYRRGEYARALTAAVAAHGSQSFRHEVVFTSLLIHNLETLDHECLAENEAGYDMRHMARSIRELVDVLGALRKWEGET